MATELICPDCGGVINADADDLRVRCQCGSELTMDDTEVDIQPIPLVAEPAAPAAAPPRQLKLCWKCGKDVTHAKRAKDDNGYWCYDCHKADREASRGGTDKPRARCPECGRLVPAESITTYHGITLCTKCRLEQEELPNHLKLKYKRKPEEDEAEKIASEKKRIKILGVVVGVIVLIILIAKFA